MTDASTIAAIGTAVVALVAGLLAAVQRSAAAEQKRMSAQLRDVRELLAVGASKASVEASGQHRTVADMLDLGERVARVEGSLAYASTQLGEVKRDLVEMRATLGELREVTARLVEGVTWIRANCPACPVDHPRPRIVEGGRQ